jgi:transposase
VLHRQLLEIVRHDEVCRRLMTTPGVGPVVALTFRATVDVPSRFTSSKAVGAAFGLMLMVEPSRRTSFRLLRDRSRVIELPVRRGLREDERRWRFGLPGACEHW